MMVLLENYYFILPFKMKVSDLQQVANGEEEIITVKKVWSQL